MYSSERYRMLSGSSVEPLSYRFEVLAKPCTSKNNTPHLPLYTADEYMTTQVMNGICLPLCLSEFARFRSTESQTLSSNNM